MLPKHAAVLRTSGATSRPVSHSGSAPGSLGVECLPLLPGPAKACGAKEPRQATSAVAACVFLTLTYLAAYWISLMVSAPASSAAGMCMPDAGTSTGRRLQGACQAPHAAWPLTTPSPLLGFAGRQPLPRPRLHQRPPQPHCPLPDHRHPGLHRRRVGRQAAGAVGVARAWRPGRRPPGAAMLRPRPGLPGARLLQLGALGVLGVAP